LLDVSCLWADPVQYDNDVSELQMFELLKVEQIVIFTKKLGVWIITVSILIEDIR